MWIACDLGSINVGRPSWEFLHVDGGSQSDCLAWASAQKIPAQTTPLHSVPQGQKESYLTRGMNPREAEVKETLQRDKGGGPKMRGQRITPSLR